MALTPQQEKKLRAAADIIQHGDLAVLAKIMDFQDTLDNLGITPQILSEAKDMVEKIRGIMPTLKSGRDGAPGKDGKEFKLTDDHIQRIANRVKIPTIEKVIEKHHVVEKPIVTNQIVRDMTESGDTIIKKVNTSDLKIKRERVDGLDEEIKSLHGKIDAKPSKMGMRKVPIIKSIDLTSQVTGATKAFKLPKDTVSVLGVWGTSFPITFSTADWTLAGNTLTLAAGLLTPAAGQTLIAIVEVLFYG